MNTNESIDPKIKVRETIAQLGALAAFDKLIEESNDLIRQPNLDNGRELTRSRCAIYSEIMADWAANQQKQFGYDQPFAVVALGGTGREEMTPCSDTDFAFLFDDRIEGNQFLIELQQQTIQSDAFRKTCGFSGETLPYNLDDVIDLDEKELNAFIDIKPVYDPDGLADRFRERIRETYDPFAHFLHASKYWREHWGELASKNEQIDLYNIKGEGLRVFLAAIWTLAGKDFRHSHEIYQELQDPRDLEAYYFLLRIRSFIHLHKNSNTPPNALGEHAEDIFRFDDFMALGELAGASSTTKEQFEFASDIRARFVTERKRIDQFTWGVIGKELKNGRIIRPGSAIVNGVGGLRDSATDRCTDRQRSRAAMAMLVASQHYDVPIDPSEMEKTFRNAGDWLIPVPEMGALFYESNGSLADSIKFLAQIPDAIAQLFPGYSKFESSIDERVLTEKKCLRGALLREKLRALENDIEDGQRMLKDARNPSELAKPDFTFSNQVEAALLDDEYLAAIRLALTTKRLPETRDDIAARDDESLPIHERFSSGLSGIPIDQYYKKSFNDCQFTDTTLELAEFLVKSRRIFKQITSKDLMDPQQVGRLVDLCEGNESRMRALYVFTVADRTEWESESQDPGRWFKIHELYTKARIQINPGAAPGDPLSNFGFDEEQKALLNNFGKELTKGVYQRHITKFAGALFSLNDSNDGEKTAIAKQFRIGTSEIIGVAALDTLGIAASISGALWKMGIEVSQAHLFSASDYGLALDFFHLAPIDPDSITAEKVDLNSEIVRAISENLYIGEADEAELPEVGGNFSFRETTSGLYQLRAQTKTDVGALIYFLTCKAYRHLGANIYNVAAHTGKDHSRISVYLKLPDTIDVDEATAIVESWNR